MNSIHLFKMWDRPVATVLRYVPIDLATPTKLACFDLDWTLIRPIKSRFPTQAEDQAFLPGRIHTLTYLYQQGWTLVVFTNQKSRTDKEVLTKMNRVNVFIQKLNLPIVVLMATADDQYRKPDIGMWSLLPFTPPTEAFYVGDAAGRPGDFADTDKVFAQNLGITFATPEQFFPAVNIPITDGRKLIILMGMPGSGKSFFYQSYLAPHNYVYLSQDQLKTKGKVMTALKRALPTGQPIVIDATNPTKAGRAEYITVAQAAGYIVDIIYVVRNGEEFNKLRAEPVPTIAYNMYFSKLEVPTTDEVNGGVYEYA